MVHCTIHSFPGRCTRRNRTPVQPATRMCCEDTTMAHGALHHVHRARSRALSLSAVGMLAISDADVRFFLNGTVLCFLPLGLSNPTVAALEERIANLEGGRGATCTSSGHAAQLVALFALMGPGDQLVASRESVRTVSLTTVALAALPSCARERCWWRTVCTAAFLFGVFSAKVLRLSPGTPPLGCRLQAACCRRPPSMLTRVMAMTSHRTPNAYHRTPGSTADP